LTIDDLSAPVHQAFGGKRTLAHIDRLHGGSKKGVYRLLLDDGTTVLAYIWNDDENYWTTGSPGPAGSAGPFDDASGAGLFEAAHRALTASGVRVPQVRLLDRSQTLVAGDVAVVEDIRGGSLEAIMRTDPDRAAQILPRLAEVLRVMHDAHRDHYGRPEEAPSAPDRPPAEHIVLQRALDHLAEAPSGSTRSRPSSTNSPPPSTIGAPP
jgi:hypothetical protein